MPSRLAHSGSAIHFASSGMDSTTTGFPVAAMCPTLRTPHGKPAKLAAQPRPVRGGIVRGAPRAGHQMQALVVAAAFIGHEAGGADVSLFDQPDTHEGNFVELEKTINDKTKERVGGPLFSHLQKKRLYLHIPEMKCLLGSHPMRLDETTRPLNRIHNDARRKKGAISVSSGGETIDDSDIVSTPPFFGPGGYGRFGTDTSAQVRHARRRRRIEETPETDMRGCRTSV